MDHPLPEIACPTCARPMPHRFCAHCGEERIDDHAWSLSHFFHDAFHEFAHLDAKIFGTFWHLIRHPGFLTAEYWNGRRNPWIRPLRLYIVVAAIHLLAVSGIQMRVEFFQSLDAAGLLQRSLEKVATIHHVSADQVRPVIAERMSRIFSLSQYLSVCLFALGPWLLFRRRRPWYVQHLVFSLHYSCFFFLLTSVTFRVLPLLSWLRAPFVLLSVAYLGFAIHRLYGDSFWPATGKAFLLRIAHIVAETVALGLALFGSLYWTARSFPH